MYLGVPCGGELWCGQSSGLNVYGVAEGRVVLMISKEFIEGSIMLRLLFSVMCFLVISLPALADDGVLKKLKVEQGDTQPASPSREEKVFDNSLSDCKINDTCDLKQVIFRKEKYILPQSDPTDLVIYGTQMLLGYKTESVATLLDYVVVQFTSGCMWNSSKSADPKDQKEVTEFGIVRKYLGTKNTQHVHRDLVVDSIDSDPVYGSGPENRHFYVQWANVIPSWIPDRQGKLMGEEPPVFPFGYITDMPGPASYSTLLSNATNMSLEYKTCLFKTKDVPRKTNGSDVSREKAIVCFDWESKFVFNHATQRFEHHTGIHPECQRPFSVREEWYRKHIQEGITEKEGR